MTRKQLLPLALCAVMAVPALAACGDDSTKAESTSTSTTVAADATAGKMTASMAATAGTEDEKAALTSIQDFQKAVKDKNGKQMCDYMVDPLQGKPLNDSPELSKKCTDAMTKLLTEDKDMSEGVGAAVIEKVKVEGDKGQVLPENIKGDAKVKQAWGDKPIDMKKVDGKWYVMLGGETAATAAATKAAAATTK